MKSFWKRGFFYIFFEKNKEKESFDDDVLKKLDNAFDFFEKALPDSPQLLLFVTELAGGYNSLEFIKKQDYKRFFEYNKNMLAGDDERSELWDV